MIGEMHQLVLQVLGINTTCARERQKRRIVSQVQGGGQVSTPAVEILLFCWYDDHIISSVAYCVGGSLESGVMEVKRTARFTWSVWFLNWRIIL